MLKESEAMKEIHEIRLNNYEITKNMSPKEKIDYINKSGEEAIEILKKLKKAHISNLN